LAIVASGVSLFRLAAPIVVTGVLLNALVLPVQEFVVPPLAGKLSRAKRHLDNVDEGRQPLHYAVDRRGHPLSAGHFDAERGQLDHVAILERDERGITTRRISATKALWNDEYHRWRLVMAQANVPQSDSEVAPPPRLEEETLHFSTQLSPTVLRARQQ